MFWVLERTFSVPCCSFAVYPDPRTCLVLPYYLVCDMLRPEDDQSSNASHISELSEATIERSPGVSAAVKDHYYTVDG
jgi:hypothetical protein